MSYILDALQRADAERERGHVPGLKSQIVPPASRKAPAPRRWTPVHTGAVLAALLLGAALWWWLKPAAQPSAATAASPAPVAAAPAAPPVPAAEPIARVRQAPAAIEPIQPILAPPLPRAEPPKRAAAPAPAAAAAPAPPPSTAAAQPSAAAPSAPVPASAPAPAAAATDTNAAPVRSFGELSPEARAQLPPVSVSGSTYSKNPALRMLIINGKVIQEGQEIAPGFKLETIGQRSAVLNHQGLRYSIGY
ncbi:MAG: general secretion pathway protein GspB [Hydrogenophaga sp.]|uniref:general secretion pathway protein GspB n=1 Tax=Hydrogenophaga sp. TaxID=1904254 RepID=UPI004036C047